MSASHGIFPVSYSGLEDFSQNCPFSCASGRRRVIHGSFGEHEPPPPNRHLDRFRDFSTIYGCDQQTDTQTGIQRDRQRHHEHDACQTLLKPATFVTVIPQTDLGWGGARGRCPPRNLASNRFREIPSGASRIQKKTFIDRGSAPDPAGGAYSAPADPLEGK